MIFLRRNFLFLIGMIFTCLIEAKKYKNPDRKIKKYKTLSEKKELFQKIRCVYSNTMKIDPIVELVPSYQTQYFKDNEKRALELSDKYRKDVENKILAPMYLEFISSSVGCGVKAASGIKADDFIGVYAGFLRNPRWNDPKIKEDLDYAWYYTVADKNNKDLIIDGKYEGNELRFINHATNPNTKRIDVIVNNRFYICYIAIKNIAQDEELTVSYGQGYWSSRGVAPEDLI